MGKLEKQTVYLPVKENGNYSIHWNKDKIFNHAVMKEGYFFTPEQLNQFLSDVIKGTLETAAEKAEMTGIAYGNDKYVTDYTVDKKSITKTFEETFKKFEV